MRLVSVLSLTRQKNESIYLEIFRFIFPFVWLLFLVFLFLSVLMCPSIAFSVVFTLASKGKMALIIVVFVSHTHKHSKENKHHKIRKWKMILNSTLTNTNKINVPANSS